MPEFASDRQRAAVAASVQRQGLPAKKNRQPVEAYVNHGRWVVDCPCGGAELVTPGEDMLCGSCGMSSPVSLPPFKTRNQIDGLLEKRPPFNQNWRGEDMAEVLGENIAAGLET